MNDHNETMNESQLVNLPRDLLKIIFQQVLNNPNGIVDYINLMLTCTRFNDLGMKFTKKTANGAYLGIFSDYYIRPRNIDTVTLIRSHQKKMKEKLQKLEEQITSKIDFLERNMDADKKALLSLLVTVEAHIENPPLYTNKQKFTKGYFLQNPMLVSFLYVSFSLTIIFFGMLPLFVQRYKESRVKAAPFKHALKEEYNCTDLASYCHNPNSNHLHCSLTNTSETIIHAYKELLEEYCKYEYPGSYDLAIVLFSIFGSVMFLISLGMSYRFFKDEEFDHTLAPLTKEELVKLRNLEETYRLDDPQITKMKDVKILLELLCHEVNSQMQLVKNYQSYKKKIEKIQGQVAKNPHKFPYQAIMELEKIEKDLIDLDNEYSELKEEFLKKSNQNHELSIQIDPLPVDERLPLIQH